MNVSAARGTLARAHTNENGSDTGICPKSCPGVNGKSSFGRAHSRVLGKAGRDAFHCVPDSFAWRQMGTQWNASLPTNRECARFGPIAGPDAFIPTLICGRPGAGKETCHRSESRKPCSCRGRRCRTSARQNFLRFPVDRKPAPGKLAPVERNMKSASR
jgi:hypothetical protein